MALEDGRTVRWLPTRYKHCTDILEYLDVYSGQHGYMPSRREISLGCKVVVSSVNYYLGFMEEDGWIEVAGKLSRAISITEEGRRFLEELKIERDALLQADGSKAEGGDVGLSDNSST